MNLEHDDDILDLVHAEIDGTLTGPQRAELNARLLADPALRALRDELRRTCAALDAIPAEEAPAGLAASIMDRLPADPPACDDTDVLAPRRGGFQRPVLRYAAALAGGLLVSALAFQFASTQRRLDAGELVGTIAPTASSRLDLRLDQVTGSIELSGAATAPVVTARLAATQPIQVIARVEGQEVRLGNFIAPQQQPRVASAPLQPVSTTEPPVVEVLVVDEASGAVLRSARLRPNFGARE